MSVKEWLLLVVKGSLVGAGAILPGISGGVLCVAFGIYEPMMALLAHPLKSFRTYGRMFVPFLLGWVCGFVLLAGLVEMLFEGSAAVAMMLFAGLIFGTLPQLLQDSEQKESTGWSPLLLALVSAMLLISFLNKASAAVVFTPGVLTYVFAGAVWGLSLILPGLSSSALLIFLGIYQPMTAGIAALDLQVILPLLGGLSLTVLTLSRLVNRLFEQRRGLILKVISGIMIAATLCILPESFPSVFQFAVSLLCFLTGFFLARSMDRQKEKWALS